MISLFALERRSVALLFINAFFSLITNTNANGQAEKPRLPKEKQTTLGLYVTAKEAYSKWNRTQSMVKIIDVRTTEEYLFVGHPVMAWNIPFRLQTYQCDTENKRFPMKPNPDFVSAMKQIARATDTLIIICRSGGRSAMAVNKLAEEGFKNVFSTTDGFEGDIVTDSTSVFQGQRLINGWKNSGLPWTYSIEPKLMLIPNIK